MLLFQAHKHGSTSGLLSFWFYQEISARCAGNTYLQKCQRPAGNCCLLCTLPLRIEVSRAPLAGISTPACTRVEWRGGLRATRNWAGRIRQQEWQCQPESGKSSHCRPWRAYAALYLDWSTRRARPAHSVCGCGTVGT